MFWHQKLSRGIWSAALAFTSRKLQPVARSRRLVAVQSRCIPESDIPTFEIPRSGVTRKQYPKSENPAWGKRGFLGEAGILGEISGFINKTREPGIKFKTTTPLKRNMFAWRRCANR
jgi:hypothetical protein